MLATVRGIVVSSSLGDVVIEVNGIGYSLSVPRDLSATLRVGHETLLHTVLIPREDEWLLFGFATPDEKQLFTLLRGVSGVGPRTALNILSQLSVAEIFEAVEAADDSPFRAVSGIGQKTASLIIVSLTGKMPQQSPSDVSELAEALTGLGWTATDSREVARDVVRDYPDMPLGERLRIALAALGGSA